MLKRAQDRTITSTNAARTQLLKMSGALPTLNPEKPAIVRRASRTATAAATIVLNKAPQLIEKQDIGDSTTDYESWVQHPKPRLLIVDDQPMVGSSIAGGLAYFGYEAVSCHLPDEVFMRLHAESFDLLLIDVAMPGIGGLELVAQIRDAGFVMPVVLMSGYWRKLDSVEMKRLGITMFLPKPFTLRLLDQNLRLACASAR